MHCNYCFDYEAHGNKKPLMLFSTLLIEIEHIMLSFKITVIITISFSINFLQQNELKTLLDHRLSWGNCKEYYGAIVLSLTGCIQPISNKKKKS
jgi:hypothetical protein